jgi:hypothetical protein
MSEASRRGKPASHLPEGASRRQMAAFGKAASGGATSGRPEAAASTDESACTPDSVAARGWGARRAAIHLGLPLPVGSSGPPAGSGGQPSNACAGHRLAAAALLGLAPGGVYRATPVTRDAGGLLPHRFTLTGHTAGGLLSVALSRGSPRVAVSNHPALWSPDVPRQRGANPADATARPTRPSPSHSTPRLSLGSVRRVPRGTGHLGHRRPGVPERRGHLVP